MAVLLAFYKLFLEKESFFTANRIYLLGSLALTFSLPLLSLPQFVEKQGFISGTLEKVLYEALSAARAEEARFIQEPADASSSKASRDYLTRQNNSPVDPQRGAGYWLLLLYFFGLLVLSLNLLGQITSMLLKAFRSTDKVKDTGYTLVNCPLVKEPCSFFRYIFLDPGSYDHATYEQIIAHEKIHVRKRHSVDLLLAEIAVIALWFNPLAWLFRREVEKNLEYQTDDLLLSGKKVEKAGYQMNLLKIATYNKPLRVTTNYNQSLIKQRILKMSAKRSNSHNYWKYVFLAPVVFGMLLSMNRPLIDISQNEAQLSPGSGSQETPAVSADDCGALLRTVKSEDISRVKELLKTVDPDCLYREDGEPRSPLVAAARSGNLEIGKLLVEAKADVEFHDHADESPLMATSANGYLDFSEYLVDQGADVNRKVDGDGTPLLVASRKGRTAIVKYLISKGADVNGQVDGDGTPLINSVRNGHYDISQLLLENGAEPFLVSPGDEYPMYHAIMSGDTKMIALLKKYDKDN